MAGSASLIRRLCRQWRVHAYLDFMWITKDFKYCLICIISDIIMNLAGVTAVFLLAERFHGIGIWRMDQIVFMLGYAAIVQGIMDMGFSYNVLHISRRIGRGQMDHVLIQPQPIWMALLTEGFLPFSGSWAFLTGISITTWAVIEIGMTLSLWSIFWFSFSLLSSCTVVLAFSFLWGSLAFWAPVGAHEISSEATRILSQLRTYPLDGLGKHLQKGLLSVLPVGFVAWLPARALTGIGTPETLWYTPLAALVLALLAAFAFNRGLKHYEKTGSQRYLPWAHRS
jgi:ABC-2 type transport system permease protein